MFVSEIFDEAADILGTTDQNKVFRKLSQAVQSLMETGHWFHTNAEVDVCTGWDGQTITLPRGIEVPLGVNVDGSPQYFRNRLFQYSVNKGGMYNPVGWAWDDRGFVATQMDIRQPSQLVAVAETDNDVGKKIRVIGTDNNNRPLRSQLPDGTGVDGLLVTIHSKNDFPYGLIQPEYETINTRTATISPLNQFYSSSVHQLMSGQAVVLNTNGSAMNYFINGKTYYIGVVDPNNVQLYTNPLDAQAGTNAISAQSIVGVTSITLTDSRPSNLVAAIETSVVPSIPISTANSVTFSGTNLPSPIISGATYYANQLTTQSTATGIDLQVYSSLNDANNTTNPIALTGNSGPFNIQIRKPIAPEPLFTFSVAHNFNNGDVVQAINTGGALPQPLLANQNYYAHVISSKTISIHTNYTDAIAGTNPILLTTSGSGTNSFAKLIPASASIGTSNNIVTSDFSLPTPTGSGGIGKAYVSGSITSVNVTNAPANYSSTPTISLSDIGGISYTVAPTVSIVNPIGFVSPATMGGFVAASYVIGTSNLLSGPSGTGKYVDSNTSNWTTVSTGQGYDPNNPPTVVFTNGAGDTTGYGAAASVTVDPTAGSLTLTMTGWGSGGSLQAIMAGSGATQSVAGVSVISGGSGYLYGPRLTFSTGNAAATAVVTTSIVDHIDVINGGTGYTTPPSVTITQAGASGATANANINTGITSITVTTNGINYSATPIVKISDPTGSGASATCSVTSGAIASVTIKSTGANYTNPTISFIDPYGSGAAATAAFGTITSFTIVTAGTSYSSQNPKVTLIPSTGIYVQFSSTGTLPSPLVQGTTYRAEQPSSSSGFTLKNTDSSVVNITDLGSGTLYLVVSRTYSVGFNGLWYGDFTGLTQGSQIYFSTDYLLPVGSPTISTGTIYYYGPGPTNSEGYIYSDVTLLNKVTVSQLGTGQTYYAVQLVANAVSYNSLIQPSSIQYLSAGETVQFSSTGSLPTPLTANTNYTIQISGNNVVPYTVGGTTPIPLTTLGVGQLSLKIVRTFTPSASTSLVANEALYVTGEKVLVRANSDDVLPTGLIANTTYYVKRDLDRLGSNNFELYDTYTNATNVTSAYTGRISYTTSGNTTTSSFLVDGINDPILVKAVQHIDKPLTEGYVSLYALDYGRSNDMALIGQYHPNEVNPMYRRIRIGVSAAWARIIYRVSAPTITSIYDYIPIEQTRAIIAAVHAVDLEDKDFIEQSQKYWAMALSYLKNQQNSMEGHAFMPPQINNITYGDGTDPVIDSGAYGYW